jgi:hypothetical protein
MHYPGPKILFIHIPKTAGTSVITKLNDAFGEQDTKRWGVQHHATMAEWVDRIGVQKLKEHFIFSVVRNPWDRMVSWFTYTFRRTEREQKKLNFKEWLRDEADPTIWRYMPQVNYLKVDGELVVDRVLLFHRLSRMWKELVGERLRGQCRYPRLDWGLAHLNSSERKKRYQDYYDDKTRDTVADRYVEDIQEFGFTFEC